MAREPGPPPPPEDGRRRRAEEVREVRRRPPPPWAFENPWAWVLLLGLLIAGGVLAAILLTRDDDEKKAQTTTIVQTSTTPTTTATQPPPPPPPKVVAVPNVVGESQADAGTTLQDAGFVPNSYPAPSSEAAGTVVSQNPPSGSDLAQGQDVRLNVSVGSGARGSVTVPDVTGPTAEDARDTLWNAKLTVLTVERVAPSSEEVGEVLTQAPAAGATVPTWSQVTIFVGESS